MNPAPPATALLGLRVEIVGTALIVNGCAPVETPSGVTTVTLAEPAKAISAAGTLTVVCPAVSVARVVEAPALFQTTVSPAAKLVPVKVRVKAPKPAVWDVGLMLVRVGAARTLYDAGAEEAPSTETTVMGTVTGEVVKLAGTVT